MRAKTRRTAISASASLLMLGATIVPVGSQTGVSYTYDSLGRLTTALYDNGMCVAYSYDANGNRTANVNTLLGSPPSAVWGSAVWGCFSWTP